MNTRLFWCRVIGISLALAISFEAPLAVRAQVQPPPSVSDEEAKLLKQVAAPPVAIKADAPNRDELERQAIQTRQLQAMQWAALVSHRIPKSPEVIPVSFFEKEMGAGSNPTGLLLLANNELTEAAMLFNAMTELANSTSDLPTLKAAWLAKENAFIQRIDDEGLEDLEHKVEIAWRQFFEKWRNELEKINLTVETYRKALQEAALIIPAVCFGHISAIPGVTNPNGPSGSGSTTSSGSATSGGEGGVSHLGLHNRRAMNRITERHARRMIRIKH